MSAMQVRLIRLSLIVFLLALWEYYARFVSTSSLVAGPTDVALAWWPKVMGDPGVRLAVLATFIELVVAFALSVVFGMLIGVLVGLSNLGRRSIYPVVLLLYGIPRVVVGENRTFLGEEDLLRSRGVAVPREIRRRALAGRSCDARRRDPLPAHLRPRQAPRPGGAPCAADLEVDVTSRFATLAPMHFRLRTLVVGILAAALAAYPGSRR